MIGVTASALSAQRHRCYAFERDFDRLDVALFVKLQLAFYMSHMPFGGFLGRVNKKVGLITPFLIAGLRLWGFFCGKIRGGMFSAAIG